MSAVGYARTSPSTDEEGERTSIPNQKESIKKYCDDEDIELVNIFSDEGVSGRKNQPHEREGFQDLLNRIETHREDDKKEEIEKIVVKDKDRFSRDEQVLNGLHFYKKLHDIEEIEIVEAESLMGEALEQIDEVIEEMDDSSIEKKFLQDARDEIEEKGMKIKQIKALITSAKTQNALNGKSERGEPVGNIGYGLTTDKQKHGTDEAKKYLPDDKEEDHFKRVISTLNQIIYEDIDVYTREGKSANALGRENDLDVSNKTDAVRNIWERRHLYWLVATKHRPEIGIFLPDELDEDAIREKVTPT